MQPPPQKSNFELMLENFVTTTNNNIQQLQARNKLMENQISQLAHQVGQSVKTPGAFLGQTEKPPKGHMNAVTLRSGKQLEYPPTREPSKEVMDEVVPKDKVVDGTTIEEEPKESTPPPLIPCNIRDAISSYAKFLKDMLSNKKKLEDNAIVVLNAELKLGDIDINKALCDLGASVSLMPLSICKKLQMGELKPTRMSLLLPDRSVKFPLGILEDFPLRVGKFFIPCDFVVIEMEEDAHVPIILGRPFLATAGAIIDMMNGRITFEVGD
ncbi:uncharacterized protein LOC110730162 [Chenopodium quinoa]|uniref:uncharacterized protein LOC110730162 n=1 Tax=Chenopodium quinoa TaxID=63459 RepID=UPI000B77941C|nr:uncharacterized protein LOC110730162 [Chenopodium quinoa]